MVGFFVWWGRVIDRPFPGFFIVPLGPQLGVSKLLQVLPSVSPFWVGRGAVN